MVKQEVIPAVSRIQATFFIPPAEAKFLIDEKKASPCKDKKHSYAIRGDVRLHAKQTPMLLAIMIDLMRTTVGPYNVDLTLHNEPGKPPSMEMDSRSAVVIETKHKRMYH